ncbi:MAG TPA: hypothetical protein ENJ24_05425 [Gammaproteobacteria bacterium]|nr:hypothetical protein [Gammaproteobacteria bacterium]
MVRVREVWWPYLFLLACIAAPVILWLQTAGRLEDYLHPALPGQTHYVLSKLSGLITVFLLWAQLCLGLAQSIGSWRFRVSIRTHQWLGMVTVMVMLLHYFLFVTAVWQRKGTFPFNLFIPRLDDYYHSALTIGQLALVLTALVVFAGKKHFYHRQDRRYFWLHRLSFPVFGLVLLHSYLVGSEAQVTIAGWAYVLMLVVVLALLGGRLHVRK